jgi:hypothetical protein
VPAFDLLLGEVSEGIQGMGKGRLVLRGIC